MMEDSKRSNEATMGTYVKKLKEVRGQVIRQLTEIDALTDQLDKLRLGPEAEARLKGVNEGNFLVGDKVKRRTNKKGIPREPKVGTVVSVTKCYLYVKLDDGTMMGRTHNNSWKHIESSD